MSKIQFVNGEVKSYSLTTLVNESIGLRIVFHPIVVSITLKNEDGTIHCFTVGLSKQEYQLAKDVLSE